MVGEVPGLLRSPARDGRAAVHRGPVASRRRSGSGHVRAAVVGTARARTDALLGDTMWHRQNAARCLARRFHTCGWKDPALVRPAQLSFGPHRDFPESISARPAGCSCPHVGPAAANRSEIAQGPVRQPWTAAAPDGGVGNAGSGCVDPTAPLTFGTPAVGASRKDPDIVHAQLQGRVVGAADRIHARVPHSARKLRERPGE
jgi:hypothetical protein